MKIFARLTGAFGIVALICAIVGFVGWYGIDRTEESLNEVADVRVPSVQGLGLMMEGMNAIKSAERTHADLQPDLRGPAARDLRISTSAGRLSTGARPLRHPCRKSAREEAIWREVNPLIAAWKKEHEKTGEAGGRHQTGRSGIGACDSPLPPARSCPMGEGAGTGGQRAARAFTGQLDSTLCNLGKWLTASRPRIKPFAAILGKFNGPHERLHSLGEKINAITDRGDRSTGARDL